MRRADQTRRLFELLRIVNEHPGATAVELHQQLGGQSLRNTRRDLTALEQSGLIWRAKGGGTHFDPDTYEALAQLEWN